MTTPAGAQEQQVAVPPYDPGNTLLGGTPAQLSCALVPTEAGQRLALTIRTVSTTQTVFLDRQDADLWASQIKAAASAMTGLILAGPGAMPGQGMGG